MHPRTQKILSGLLAWTALCGLWVFATQRDSREQLHEIRSTLRTLLMFDPSTPSRTRFEFSLERPADVTFILKGISATDQLLLASQEKVGFTVSTWITEKEWQDLSHSEPAPAPLRLNALGFKTRNATYLNPPREVSEQLSLDRAVALLTTLLAGALAAYFFRKSPLEVTDRSRPDPLHQGLARNPLLTCVILGALILAPVSFCLPRGAFFPVWLIGLNFAGLVPFLPIYRRSRFAQSLQEEDAQLSRREAEYRNNRIQPAKETDGLAAARDRALKAVEMLLTQKGDQPNLNLRNARGETPLLIAIRARSDRAARLLLEKGADPNAATPDGRTPLHEAAHLGDLVLCQALIEAGANPLAQDAKKETPLQEAERLNPPNRTLVSYLETQIRTATLKAHQKKI